ncbi:MAG: response regulator transcription factor [Traorella sp.]
MYRILIVEDDLVIAKEIEKKMIQWGYECKKVNDFKNVMNEFISFDPQLVLLDISLPFYNGYHWCNEMRKISKVPILFISSASDSMNIVMAINMGGDDFVSKPINLDILCAKIQALLRRSYDFTAHTNVIEHKDVLLNTNDMTLNYHSQKLELTKNEYRILLTLMENKGKVISREKLMIKLWESDEYIDENTLTVNMTRLRRKLESYGIYDFISTKKGLGYIIE